MNALPAPDEIRAALSRVGETPDEALDLADAALILAALDRPRVPLDRYRDHLAALAGEVREAAGAAPSGAEGAAEALRSVLARTHGYEGDQATYDDPQNGNLMRVIDRKRGLPIALGILYIHAARAQGWSIVGLNFPGHFLVRLERDGSRAILDPFHGGRTRGTGELRDLLKTMAGVEAELTPRDYAPLTDRGILIRLQNNLKVRFLKAEQYGRALDVIDAMLLIAPGEPILWREAGLLQARLGNLSAAIRSLESFTRLSTDDVAQHHVAVLLQELKSRLN